MNKQHPIGCRWEAQNLQVPAPLVCSLHPLSPEPGGSRGNVPLSSGHLSHFERLHGVDTWSCSITSPSESTSVKTSSMDLYMDLSCSCLPHPLISKSFSTPPKPQTDRASEPGWGSYRPRDWASLYPSSSALSWLKRWGNSWSGFFLAKPGPENLSLLFVGLFVRSFSSCFSFLVLFRSFFLKGWFQ